MLPPPGLLQSSNARSRPRPYWGTGCNTLLAYTERTLRLDRLKTAADYCSPFDKVQTCKRPAFTATNAPSFAGLSGRVKILRCSRCRPSRALKLAPGRRRRTAGSFRKPCRRSRDRAVSFTSVIWLNETLSEPQVCERMAYRGTWEPWNSWISSVVVLRSRIFGWSSDG